ncbi:unnamed protein product [Miscanthus lutarioriparius]|uniref:Uncharacterized protein n=1 Tax=Miscanthus lutarioriparius TaxID=422564 RepID=A0A811P0Z8_9POAL|nr:unnamed protein product [Miscanthus lutarioriparius]
MEWLQDPLSCVFLVTLAVVLLQLRRRGKAPLPPGPKPLPIVYRSLISGNSGK